MSDKNKRNKSGNNEEFVLKIDNEKKNTGFQSNRPAGNGEIYFANYQKNGEKTGARRPAPQQQRPRPDSRPVADDKYATKKVPAEATQLFKAQSGAKPRPQSAPQRGSAPTGNRPKAPAAAQQRQPNGAPAQRTRRPAPQQGSKLNNATARTPQQSKPAKAPEGSSKPQNPNSAKSRFQAAKRPQNANKKMTQRRTQESRDNDSKNFLNKNLFSEQAKEERKVRRAMRRSEPNYVKRLFVSLICVVLVTAIFSSIGIGCINDILAINGNDEEVRVTIESGMSTNQVISLLKKSGLIHHKAFCNLFADFRGYGKDEYEVGDVYLTRNMGLEGMLNTAQGNISYDEDDVVTLFFPEGWTIQQIVEKLVKNDVVDNADKFLSALEFDYNFAYKNDNTSAAFALEGTLFPDTYDFYVGESPGSIIRKFLSNFENKWTTDYTKRAKELGFTPTEIITIASIIQKEAGNVDQMTGISAVIHNRLKNSVDYPTLGCDSTVNYVTKYLKEFIGESKANQYLDSYDTNSKKTGLPSGPICNPGEDAIKAALYPDETSNYLYFNHDDMGKIYYAASDIEFARNVAEAQKVNAENAKQYS